MTVQKETPGKPQAKTDLAALYRPLGLKAVLAAALMVKGKPGPGLKKKLA